jgi:hypothetical protein
MSLSARIDLSQRPTQMPGPPRPKGDLLGCNRLLELTPRPYTRTTVETTIKSTSTPTQMLHVLHSRIYQKSTPWWHSSRTTKKPSLFFFGLIFSYDTLVSQVSVSCGINLLQAQSTCSFLAGEVPVLVWVEHSFFWGKIPTTHFPVGPAVFVS